MSSNDPRHMAYYFNPIELMVYKFWMVSSLAIMAFFVIAIPISWLGFLDSNAAILALFAAVSSLNGMFGYMDMKIEAVARGMRRER